jgi:hypothetical protein
MLYLLESYSLRNDYSDYEARKEYITTSSMAKALPVAGLAAGKLLPLIFQ